MKAIDRRLDSIQRVALVALFTLLFAAVTLQVLSRYVFGRVYFWTEEVATFLFVWVVLLGACLVLRNGQHIAVSLFVSMLPSRLRVAVLILKDVLLLITLVLLTYFGVQFTVRSMDIPSAAMGVSLGYLFAAVPVSSALMLVTVLRDIGEHVALLSKRSGGTGPQV